MRAADDDEKIHLALAELIEDGYLEGAAVFRPFGRRVPVIQHSVLRLTSKGRQAIGQSGTLSA